MEEEYWLKFGFKENGELACVRTLSKTRPAAEFFYNQDGQNREVISPCVVKLTKDVAKTLEQHG